MLSCLQSLADVLAAPSRRLSGVILLRVAHNAGGTETVPAGSSVAAVVGFGATGASIQCDGVSALI